MDKFTTPLCKLAYKYGSDKCPQIKHHFTEFYFELFEDKTKKVKKVVELGVESGASLFMWRDFFPKAKIYGADANENLLFKTARIETFVCDQTKKNDLKKLIKKIGKNIDLFIDNSSHDANIQLSTCLTLMPQLSKKTLYVIEDVLQKEIVGKLAMYECQLKRKSRMASNDDRLLLVKQKS